MTDAPDAPQDRLAVLQGALGDDAQFAATLARQTEIIDQRFDLFRFISGEKVTVLNGQQPLIAGTE
jgi:hypothetical protein